MPAVNINPTSSDVIVIGAGVMGAATAYHLAKQGNRVQIFEQYQPLHSNGSSHGDTRIIRYAYDHAIYIQMARRAFSMWHALSDEAGETLLEVTGMLDFGRPDHAEYQATRATMTAEGIAYEALSAQEVSARFPMFRLHSDETAVLQPDAGYLYASRCVAALLRLAKSYGAVLHAESPIQRIVPQTGSVTIETTDGTYTAESMVIAAGAWTNTLLNPLGVNLPLQLWRQQVLYFHPPEPMRWQRGSMPIFLQHAMPIYYGIPTVGDGVKIAIHKYVDSINPDAYMRRIDPGYLSQVQAWAADYLPSLGTQISKELTCLYSMTPDEHFIIDRHPQHPHIVYASPCSGHGFKFGMVIGDILATMACGTQPEFDLSLFRASRFAARAY